MRRCKRVFSFVVVVCMVIVQVVSPIGWQEVWAKASVDYEYTVLDDGNVELTKYIGTDTAIEIPAVIDEKNVTAIGERAFYDGTGIKNVDIPDSVTRIGKSAFYNCTSLEAVSLPDGLLDIEGYAFCKCVSMEEIIIPNKVTSLGEHIFQECAALSNVRLPDEITDIADYAFCGCTSMTWLELPDRITNIGENAFGGCINLEGIDFPDGVVNIRDYAFYNCTSLSEIKIPVSMVTIGDSAFGNCNSLNEIVYSGTEDQWNDITIASGNEAFQNADIFCEGSMYKYTGLADGSIEITEYIGSDTMVYIPDMIDDKLVTSIKYDAFRNHSDLEAITIPYSVTKLGIEENDGVFLDCTKLRAIHVEDENTVFSSNDGVLFNKQKTELIRYPRAKEGEKYTIPDSVESIRKHAFCYTTGLKNVTIPSKVSNIGYGAFAWCEKITEITVPPNVTQVERFAFAYCKGVVKVTISSGVTSIGEYGFGSCEKLAAVTMPTSVSKIDRAAFYECSSLKDVYYDGNKPQWDEIDISKAPWYENMTAGVNANEPLFCATIHFSDGTTLNGPNEDYEYQILSDETVEITKYKGTDIAVKIPAELGGKPVVKIANGVFLENDNLKEVTISSGVVEVAGNAFQDCSNLVNIYVEKGNGNYASDDGVLFNKAKTELVRYPEGKEGTYSVPDSVIKIGSDSFSACTGLMGIYIPQSVTSIKWSAFRQCTGLREINIPISVTSIEGDAFLDCTGLGVINIPSKLTRIEDGTFAGCTGLKKINIPVNVTSIGGDAFSDCTGLTEIDISNGVKSIEDCVFTGCTSLKMVNIPISMTRIGDSVFSLCSSLEDVYYSGTKEQWNKIKIGSDNDELLNATIHYKGEQPDLPEEIILPTTVDAKQELERLKTGDAFSLEQDFQHYLSNEQIDMIESCLYTWLAEINYAYKYSGASGIKERLMKKAGIDPEGNFESGTEQAITHISVETKYGPKTLEIRLNLGKPDSSGNLYPAYGSMHYEILEKDSIPSDIPKSGQIGRTSYADLGTFVECVRKTSEDSLHGTYQWESLDHEMTAGVLVDKTVTEIIGNKNGSFSEGTFIIYVKPLLTYSKKVTISCPVDVHVYSMDGKEVGSVIDNKPYGGDQNVHFDVNGDSKSVYLTGNDYYLNLLGTDTGTMKYEVEEIANEEVRRNVQFLELQLQKDMQYEGYVFRPLNIDSELYALRKIGDFGQEVFYADEDKNYQILSVFKQIQGLSLSQKSTLLDTDKTVQLSASLFPLDASNPNLQWSTDNESVVKVDGNGLVTAVGAGKAVITVATKDGSFLKQFCIIDVADKNDDRNENLGSSSSGSTGGSSGWYGGGSTPVGQEKDPVVVKLHYVLQFNANGGTGLSRRTMTLLENDSPGIMPKVKRKDYLFKGWYTKQNGGTQVTGEKPLKEAVTLYAQWVKAEAPAKAAAPKLKAKKNGRIQVSFQSVAGAAGYQIEYSTSKKFLSAKIKEMKTAKAKTITGLKAGKKYYVRVRAYQLDSMKNRIYGAYSAVKSIKTKK